jgi:nicotinamidase-related amidase
MLNTQKNNPSEQNNVALLVIDVQQGLFERSTPIYKADELLQNIRYLADQAHRNDAPVIYIQHCNQDTLVKGSPSWQLHDQLKPLSIDTIVHKQVGNAFEGTSLDETLRARNISNLVITGLVTHGCVKATCLGALKLGYKVILVKDGHSNFSKQAERIIEGTNKKLSLKKVVLKSASEIEFG